MKKIFTLILILFTNNLFAAIKDKAELSFEIIMNKTPSSRPMTVAYIPEFKNYYIADGGLAPVGNEAFSKSEIHVFNESGHYLKSYKPGFDNRSIYFNPRSKNLETITYNVSSAVGFFPNTGIFKLALDDKGLLTNKSDTVSNFNSNFGSASTMPSFDPANNLYFAKQEKSDLVIVIDAESNDIKKEIHLDLKSANVQHHDITDHFIAFTGKKEFEFVLLDVDHKEFLIFNIDGKFIGKSSLPKDLKIRAKNHFNGIGYANDMYFIYIDSASEFGTYYGFKIFN
ncbi:MAG: hypothetical protein VW238_02415 [Nitrosomonadales bacterium]|jgi:hypothetical protein